MQPAPGLTTLFLDLNAYFASVEQQLEPSLRGRPVAVVVAEAETACCIAASYEAKRQGVSTGMRVAEARRACPGIQFAKSRPQEYVRFHQAVRAAVETCLPVHAVHSIDEFSCRLAEDERTSAQASALATKVKQAIRERVGECLRCSVGLAPNRVLAKIASDMQKPDGLTVIMPDELPGRLFGLELADLPGIGARMERRLARHGICTVEELCGASAEHLKLAWGGVWGLYWWHWLRGHDLPDKPTRKSSVGHQHVLPPQLRTTEAARGVTIRLLHKAAARLRAFNCRANRLTLTVQWREWGGWQAEGQLGGSQDTLEMAALLAVLWRNCPRGTPTFVGVTLSGLDPVEGTTRPLFPEETKRVALNRAMDRLNVKFGRHTVSTASMFGYGAYAPGGVAFSSIPDLTLPDAVG